MKDVQKLQLIQDTAARLSILPIHPQIRAIDIACMSLMLGDSLVLEKVIGHVINILFCATTFPINVL